MQSGAKRGSSQASDYTNPGGPPAPLPHSRLAPGHMHELERETHTFCCPSTC